MLKLQLDTKSLADINAQLDPRRYEIAIAWALNDTATEVQQHIQDRMKVVFDRPTRWTQRAFGVVRGARPSQLVVEMSEKSSDDRHYYLRVQEFGGPRNQTGFEKRLALGSPLPMRTAVPTDHARLDKNGNWSSGERNQVMSQLKIGRDVGYSSNETESSRKRRPKKVARYFMPKHGLAPGIYRRDAPGGIPIRILAVSEQAATYKPILGLHEETEREFWRRLPEHMVAAFEKMIAKGRRKG